MSTGQEQPKTSSDTSLKLAISTEILQSKLIQKPSPQYPSSESEVLKWKQKAKNRKQELLRLKEDLQQAEDNSHCNLFGQIANCKCYFFDNLGKLSPNLFGNESDLRLNEVLRRRFLRQVRVSERRRKRKSSRHAHLFSDGNIEDEIEQLRASVDFLVELCDTVNPVKVEERHFLNWSHQAVDFILATLKNRLSTGNNPELLDGIVCGLILRLVRRMCSASKSDESHHLEIDVQFHVQHLIRNLGSECYVGQRVILSVSQRIAVLGESLLFMDPFDDAFPNMHDCMYLMMQLIEFLVSDYLLTWSSSEAFDTRLFEDGVTSIFHAKKALEALESRSGLYILYIERVIGDLGKKWGQISSLQKLNPNILPKLNPNILANLLLY